MNQPHHNQHPDDDRTPDYQTAHRLHLPAPGHQTPNLQPDQPPTARPTRPLDDQRPPTSADGPVPSPTLPLTRSGNHHGTRTRRAASLLPQLSQRDRAMLRELERFRLMTGKQLQCLFVTSSNPATAARRSRQLLTRLRELGLLHRLTRRIGGIQAGSAGHVYALTGLGHAVLALARPDTAGRYGRTIWETAPAFQDHLLAIAELYVSLRQMERSGDLELLAFDTEPLAWRSFIGPSGERRQLKPDAFLALGVGDVELRVFIEVDRSTESLPTIGRKCRRYLDYWYTGTEQLEHGVFPRVWWLTDSSRREARIGQLIAGLPTDGLTLFATGQLGDAPGVLLGHIGTTEAGR